MLHVQVGTTPDPAIPWGPSLPNCTAPCHTAPPPAVTWPGPTGGGLLGGCLPPPCTFPVAAGVMAVAAPGSPLLPSIVPIGIPTCNVNVTPSCSATYPTLNIISALIVPFLVDMQ